MAQVHTQATSNGHERYEPHISETRYERLRRQRRLSFKRWMAAYAYDVLTLLHEARVSLIGFIVVLLTGTLYWTLVYEGADYTIGAALFETVRMLALEHSQDFPPDPLGKLLFFAIPGFGLGFVFQGVLDFGRLLLDKGSRLEAWQVSLARTYHDHLIVCGLGRVSYRVVLQLLDAQYDVVVIESDWSSEFIQDTLALRVPVIHGDARDMRVLEQARISHARGLITAISNDLLNIEVALAARRVRHNMHVVLRIFNEQLDYNLEKTRFGTNTAFSSSALAAPTLAAAAVSRGVKYALPLDDEMLGISEITVTPGGRLDTLVYKIEQDFHVQVIAYTGEKDTCEVCWRHRIDPKTRLYGGDRVLLLGTLHALGEAWRHGQMSNKIMDTLGIEITQRLTPTHNRVIVCGLGKVGYRVVQVLCQLEPRPDIVVLCDQESTRPRFVKELQALGVQVIYGDARTDDVLIAAGIYRAYAVAAVTSNNLTNLRIGMAARNLRSDMHLVLRVFSDVLADQLEGMFGFHTAYSTSALAAPTLAAAAVVKGTGYAFDVGDQLMSTARLTVQPGDEFDGQRVQVLREHYGIVVASVHRKEQNFLLPGNPAQPGKLFERPLLPGDEIVLLAEIHTVALLRERGARTEDVTGTRRTRRLVPLALSSEGGATSDDTSAAAQQAVVHSETQASKPGARITAVLPPDPPVPGDHDQPGGAQAGGNDTAPPGSQALLEYLLRQSGTGKGDS